MERGRRRRRRERPRSARLLGRELLARGHAVRRLLERRLAGAREAVVRNTLRTKREGRAPLDAERGLTSSRAACYWQVWPQTDWTSPTQILSHDVEQQYESAAQIFCAHASHVAVSLVPVEQIGWAHVPPPPHDWPQIEVTSPTQTLSHAVLQQ